MSKNDTKVEDNTKVTQEMENTRWTGVMNLMQSSGEFFRITKPGGEEEWVRKDAIFSFRVSGTSVYLAVFGQSTEKYIYFKSRWEALKLAEEIATAVAKKV